MHLPSAFVKLTDPNIRGGGGSAFLFLDAEVLSSKQLVKKQSELSVVVLSFRRQALSPSNPILHPTTRAAPYAMRGSIQPRRAMLSWSDWDDGMVDSLYDSIYDDDGQGWPRWPHWKSAQFTS